MAPWPAQGNEPKAPDRNKTSDNRTLDTLKSKSEPPEDKKPLKGISKDDQSETKKKDVHSLDDGQLKALLDEAIQYKNPKDREGKSKIFRELLQKVEADDSDCSYPVVGIRGGGGRRALRVREGSRGVAVSERASRGGSLQNIFHAASSAEFDTHHGGGARKKNKRQGPGSSVSARQREGGSLPSNVNAGWPLESWQSDQIKKKGLFDRDSLQTNQVSVSFGNTAYCNSSSVATPSTQARRQTLKHSASNELPSSKKPSQGELYPLRRHHSSSDQLRSFELNIVKLKNQPESSSMVKKMPQLPKPTECVSFDMSSLNLEIKKLSDSDPSLSFEKKLQSCQNNEKYRITSCEVEPAENPSNNCQEVFTTRASLEVEPVDSSIELGFGEKRVLNGMESVQLSDNYPSVQCIVGDRTRISDVSTQGRVNEQSFGLRPHMYRNLNMNMNMIVNISSKTPNESSRTDENGNAVNVPSLTTRGASSKVQKRKLLAEKNVVFSQNIAGYCGDNDDINVLVNFIESGKAKSKQLKKLTKGKKHEKKRQNWQKSSSFEDVSQRNIDDLSESSESERTTSVRKSRMTASTDTSLRDRRRLGEQVFVKSGSQNDLNMEQEEENNSDSEFQMVTKKQRKRKVNDPNPKRPRSHRNPRRSPRRKSTSSVPPSERSGDSDLDSVHSLPVGGAPAVSYADIAAGNSAFFSPKTINEISTLNGKSPDKVESASAVKTNEIEKWCNSVNQQWEKSNVNNNNNNNNNINNNSINNKNISNTSPNNKNNSFSTNNINNNNNNNNNNIQNINNTINVSHTNFSNSNNSDLKICSKPENNRKQNLGVDVNEICDSNNVKKLKDLVIVDKSVDGKVLIANSKVVELPLKNDFKKIASNCDSDQCKLVDNSKVNDSKKNWNKKKFNREDFPSLPVKSDAANHFQKGKDQSEQAALAKMKQYSLVPSESDKSANGDGVTEGGNVADGAGTGTANGGPNPVKVSKGSLAKSDDEGKVRRSTRSKSVGPNTRPPVILLHEERTKDTSVCEITFGFEVNEQLLTSDESAQVLEDGADAGSDESSSRLSAKGSLRSPAAGTAAADDDDAADNVQTTKSGRNQVESTQTESANANGDAADGQNAYVTSSKAGLMNSTVQELFKRHESMPAVPKSIPPGTNLSPGDNSVNSIANKYVPPVAPVQFNYDKIVSFVGSAWEDVMQNGKIQYYTGDN